MKGTKITASAIAVALTVPATAQAAPLFTVAEQHNPGIVTKPQRFEAIIGYPNQCVKGIICWQYQKGTRSSVANYPESWYLHQNGVRIRDNVFHLFVMNPLSTGWQQHVAQSCFRHCFLDGMGTSSITRTTPRLRWSKTKWVDAAALVVKAVVRSGKEALPNSVGVDVNVLVNAAGRGSTEAYNVNNAKASLSMGHIWVAEKGDCLAKYRAYLRYKGTGDHFACYENGHLPWDTSWLR